MGFIYKITNNVNGKSYIGKTENTVEHRFKEHIKESTKSRCKSRPLYSAMNKYGIDNFVIEAIEECSDIDDREIFWIQFYGTYGNGGYNATKGGDGKTIINYDDVILYYEEHRHNQTVLEMSIFLGIDHSGMCRILVNNGFDLMTNRLNRVKTKKRIEIVGHNIQFESLSDAARYILANSLVKTPLKNIGHKISLVCRNKRKTAFGFEWKFID